MQSEAKAYLYETFKVGLFQQAADGKGSAKKMPLGSIPFLSPSSELLYMGAPDQTVFEKRESISNHTFENLDIFESIIVELTRICSSLC